jgi:aminopeptidase-like protein
MTPIADADRYERRYHHEVAKRAKAAMNHRAALRRWILKAADDGVDLVEIAEAAGTTLERVQDVIERERMLAEEDGWS